MNMCPNRRGFGKIHTVGSNFGNDRNGTRGHRVGDEAQSVMHEPRHGDENVAGLDLSRVIRDPSYDRVGVAAVAGLGP
jgi:hypothetical protein|tara:strand:- start:207 stop:440 length:234 start_codon:yes stop_codon:yes gene_type:complete